MSWPGLSRPSTSTLPPSRVRRGCPAQARAWRANNWLDCFLIRLDVGGACDLAKILQIAGDRGLKFRGGAACRREALLGKSGDQVGIAQRPVQLGVDARDDLMGRARGGEQADPLDCLG